MNEDVHRFELIGTNGQRYTLTNSFADFGSNSKKSRSISAKYYQRFRIKLEFFTNSDSKKSDNRNKNVLFFQHSARCMFPSRMQVQS